MKYLIVSGGSIDCKFGCELIQEEDYDIIIAADAGMNFLFDNKLKPDIIIGDFDSVASEALDYFKSDSGIEICKLNPEKDDTDTEHSVRFAIERGATDITILGGTGSRLDHVLGNIAVLGIGLEEKVQIQLIDKNNRIRMFNEDFIIDKKTQFGKYVSLIPFNGSVQGLFIKGMKYNVSNLQMGGFNSLGISNEIEDETAEISFEKGILIVVESRD